MDSCSHGWIQRCLRRVRYGLERLCDLWGRDEFDVDLVCWLVGGHDGFEPSLVMRLVGDRLREHRTYRDMLEPKNRVLAAELRG